MAIDVPPALQRFEAVTRHMIMERHINPAGNLFGGVMLAWLDEAAAIYTTEKTGAPALVTASMENVRFKAPGFRGDHVHVHCRVVRTGRSSITVEARAFAHNPIARTEREIIDCTITYVCMAENRPTPYFESDAYRECALGRDH